MSSLVSVCTVPKYLSIRNCGLPSKEATTLVSTSVEKRSAILLLLKCPSFVIPPLPATHRLAAGTAKRSTYGVVGGGVVGGAAGSGGGTSASSGCSARSSAVR